jgi:hypothetical protein
VIFPADPTPYQPAPEAPQSYVASAAVTR